ncbi:O-methyl transferase B [Xylariaceae sp. FL0662B]|nr:O-methyl transferase B [Xylariaceae sp. FL0662B]
MDAALVHITELAAAADSGARLNLITQLRKVADSLEDTTGTIHRLGHIELQKAMIQVGYDLDIFRRIVEAKDVKTVEELSRETGGEPELIKRILRYYAAINVVNEVSQGTYTCTNLTKNLNETVTRAAMQHYYGLCSPMYQAIPSYLKNNTYINPVDETHTPFHDGWRTRVNPFQWMAEHPEQLEHSSTYMAIRRQTELSWMMVYPVDEEVSGVTDPEQPLYVNISGGIGENCAQFRQRYPDVRGRIILQDLPATIAQSLPTPGVEKMAHDYLQPQPVKGAKFYFVRGVPHYNAPHNVKKLFKNIKAAMAPGSILLVDETVLPETGVGFIAASIDLTMLGAFASMERTEREWRILIESVGLELVRTYSYNRLDNECVMDIRLPRSAGT